jgi:hypothetical protein
VKLDLYNQYLSTFLGDLEIDETWTLGSNGQPSVRLSIDSAPDCNGSGDSVWLYRDDALHIIKHLRAVFNINDSEISR